MNEPTRFQRGDRVVHPRKPEWGDGVVREARAIHHEGQSAQRLTVQFTNRGRAVINTAVAPLRPTDGSDDVERDKDREMSTHTSTRQGGWIESLERSVSGNGHELWSLPEDMTDPFASLQQRLLATLNSYRFSTQPRKLIDWAVMQTGLNDPLSRYTRPELEQAFPGFARNRDQHLKTLVKKIKQNGQPELLEQARQQTRVPEGKQALEKVMKD